MATSATSSVTSSLVTALGGGSGIDMTALAANLATAQFAGRTDRLTARSETLDKQISAASNLKSMILSLGTSLGERVRQGDLSAQPQLSLPSVAQASLSGALQPKGSYSLEVSALASAQTLASPAYAAAATPVGSGTLTLQFGTVSGSGFTDDPARGPIDITIAAGATLNDVATAINGKNAGVTAYVAMTTDGAKLVVKGTDGAVNGFKLSATEAVGDPGLAALAWTPATVAPDRLLATAGNASFKIDGLPMTSASNTVVDAIPGVTLKLTGTTSGTPVRLTFGDPSSAITTAMQDLVSALNEMASELRAATDPKTGDLSRDSGALALKRSLSALGTTIIMPNAPEGTPRTLSDLGFTTQRDGSFTLDSKRLSDTLARDPVAAAAMFTNGLNGVFATIDGIARAANATSNPGSLAGSLTRYTSLQTQITQDKAKLAEKQETLRAQLVARFAVTDSRIGESKSTLSFLKNQIDAWNKSGD